MNNPTNDELREAYNELNASIDALSKSYTQEAFGTVIGNLVTCVQRQNVRILALSPTAPVSVVAAQSEGPLRLDTDTQVFFYEQDYYVLSNFSSFSLRWKGILFQTSEAAYQWEKFDDINEGQHVKRLILGAYSAHGAFKIAQEYKHLRRANWEQVKVEIMRQILRQKVRQHEYVKRKLLATGNKELIENSWRDDFWGWGEKRDGKNMLGKLWMEIREELRNTNQNSLPSDAPASAQPQPVAEPLRPDSDYEIHNPANGYNEMLRSQKTSPKITREGEERSGR